MPNANTNPSKVEVGASQSAASPSPARFQPKKSRTFATFQRHLPLLAGILVLILAVLVHLRHLPFTTGLEQLERANLDLFFHLRGPVLPDEHIHLVTIDDRSLQEFGGWQWSRQQLAKLLERILAAKPALVVCDLVLPNKPEDRDGTKMLAAVAASGKVIFPYYFSDLGESKSKPSISPSVAASAYLLFDFPEKLTLNPPIAAGRMVEPAPELAAAGLPGGHINVFPETQWRESTVRWEAQIVRYGDLYLPSLPVQATSLFLQLTRGQIQVKAGSGIQIGRIFVPTDSRGWTLINYYGPAGTFPQTSAATVLQSDKPLDFADKIIFVGVTAAGTQDFVPTPISPRMPGVEKLATSTSNILQQIALVRNTAVMVAEIMALVVIGLIALFSALRLPRLYIGVALLGLVLFVWVGAFGFFTFRQIWVKGDGVILAIVATGGVAAMLRKRFAPAYEFAFSFGPETHTVVTDEYGQPRRLGRFEIIGEIGTGAMGKIYEGFDPTINRRVAIKTLRTEVAAMGGERLRQRFLHEARAAGMLNHPNIVTVYQADEAGPYSFLAMEFLEGETLEEIIAKRAPLPLEEICRMVIPICEALDYAHRNGVVHRDIKPANIMLTKEGVLKVMDFGIAHLSYSTLTQEGAVLGTPSYMSPEQIRGDKIDGQSDIFSLGVVVYEMATGHRPFLGESLATISNRILSSTPILTSALNPNLSPALDAVLLQAMAKDKANRFPTAKAFAEALTAVFHLQELKE